MKILSQENITSSISKAIIGSTLLWSTALPSEILAQTIKPPDPAVVIVDQEILEASGLTLKSTLKHILRGDDRTFDEITDEEVEQFLQTLLSSFEATGYPNTLSGPKKDKVIVPVRPSKPLAQLDPGSLISSVGPYSLKTSAVFYRPDLIPVNFRDCGEFRIVYSFENEIVSEEENPQDGYVARFFLIFETKPRFPYGASNLDPKKDKLAACQNLGKEWAAFRTTSALPFNKSKKANIASALKRFFYNTMLKDGSDSYNRAMKRDYLGGTFVDPLGQVRGNFLTKEITSSGDFEDFWQLREWVVIKSEDNENKMRFKATATNFSPFSGLYQDNIADKNFGIRKKFQKVFFEKYADELLNPKIYNIPDTIKCLAFRRSKHGNVNDKYLVNALGLKKMDDLFLSFQEISSDESINKLFKDNEPRHSYFRKSARRFLKVTKPRGHDVKWNHLLRRAQALTCAGCHRHANRRKIGIAADKTPIIWPKAFRFVHVKEPGEKETSDNGRLSWALNHRFLKFRSCVLDGLLARPSSVPLVTRIQRNTESLHDDKIANLRATISYALSADQYDRDLDELDANVSKLRSLLLSESGAFVESRRSH